MTCGGDDEVAGGGAHCVWLRRFHKKDTGRESEEREGQFQLAKGGAHRETDLTVALLGFASSPINHAALKTARVTPTRSESTTGAPSHLWVGAARELKKFAAEFCRKNRKSDRNVRE